MTARHQVVAVARARFACASVVALALLASCSSSDLDRFRFWRHDPLSDSYVASLDRWTRKAEVAEDLTLRLGMSAVMMSDEFRGALDREARSLLALPPEAASPVLPSPIPGGVDVVVAVAAPTDKELALEAKTPFWNLLLIDATGGRWRPSKIARIEDRSPDRRFFPFHDTWSRLYLVTFPAEVVHEPGSGPVTLEATGVYGRVSVSWTL